MEPPERNIAAKHTQSNGHEKQAAQPDALTDRQQLQCIACWTTILWSSQACTQSYMPLIPLLITVELAPERVAQVFTSVMAAWGQLCRP